MASLTATPPSSGSRSPQSMPDLPTPHSVEQAIAAADFPPTMVRPDGFMQTTLAWTAEIPGGVILGPVMDARWSIVDVRALAAVAVAVLQHLAAHGGATYTVTGRDHRPAFLSR